MASAPTLLVMLLMLAAFVAGTLLIIAALRSGSQPCPSCGHRNPREAHFCARCGTELARRP